MTQLRDRIVNFLNSRTIATILIASLIALTFLFAQPGYRAFKAWRSEQILTTSQELLEEESYREAFYKAHSAVLLNPGNTDAGRHLAKLALDFGHPEAHRFWETVIRNSDAEESDWAYAIDASFRIGDYATAFDYLLRWEKAGVEDDAGFEFRRAQAYALSGQYQIAVEYVEKAAVAYPANIELRTLYLQLLSTVGSPDVKMRIAEGILAAESSYPIDLYWISRESSLPEEMRLRGIEKLLATPNLELEQELSLVSLAASYGWKDTVSRIESIRQRIDRENESQLASLTTTLCAIGAYSDVVELIDAEKAQSNRVLLRNLLVAQINEGEIDNAFEITSQQRNERLTSMAEETLIRAIAFEVAGDKAQYRDNLKLAVESAEIDDLAFLEQQFLRMEETDALLELYRKVSESSNYGPKARQLWLNLALKLRSENEIREALDSDDNWSSSLANPQDAANAVYYQLVYGINIDEARARAEELAATFSGDPYFRGLLGLAYLQSGAPERATQLVTADLPTNDPKSALMKAAVLGEAGELADYDYLPAERALVQ